eukprot:345108_1
MEPTLNPTIQTTTPTNNPTLSPTNEPSITPSYNPSYTPTNTPTYDPTVTRSPTYNPTLSPTYNPSVSPTKQPSNNPTSSTYLPTVTPTIETLSPTHQPSISPTPAQYPYVFNDAFNGLTYWNTDGNISIISSSNCPAANKAMNSIKISAQNNICVTNSYNSFWDGKYKFEYYDAELNASIYFNHDENKHLYGYITDSGDYEYYMNSYENDEISLTRCQVSTNNAYEIVVCIGNWEHYYNETWTIDADMIVVPCDDVCIENVDKPWIDGGVFKWLYYDRTRQSSIYFCEKCVNAPFNGSYLYGWIFDTGLYTWLIGVNYNDTASWSSCYLGEYLGNDYIFALSDCIFWITHNATSNMWEADTDLTATQCELDETVSQIEQLSALKMHQDSKICVSNSSISTLNVEYRWLYYDSNVNGSIYYNEQTNMFLYPYINSNHEYYWYIYDTPNEHAQTKARCKVNDASTGYIFNINDCYQNWEIMYFSNWTNDYAMYSTECQDICFVGYQQMIIPYTASFEYLFFNQTRKTNIYYCKECGENGSTVNEVYLFGFPVNNDTYWLIGPDYNAFSGWSILYTGNQEDISTYIFNVDDFVNKVGWYMYDEINGFTLDPNVVGYKCNSKPLPSRQLCVQMDGDAKIYRTLSYNASLLTGLAIGFDVNTERLLDGDCLTVEYSCDGMNVYHKLLTIVQNVIINNIIYKIPNSGCAMSNQNISIIFTVNTSSNSIGSAVYVDNFYVYYDVSNELFADEMRSNNHWNIGSENATAGFNSNLLCPSDQYCYVLNVPSSNKDKSVYIVNKINLRNEHYSYMDFSLEWSVKTSGLTTGAAFKFEVQCENNYIYQTDMCLLKQYDYYEDCFNNSCRIQLYNLPPECHFSSEIVVKCHMESYSPADKIYIDYIRLKHSDTSGKAAPECRYKTALPTTYPTTTPTKIPNAFPYVYHDRMNSIESWQTEGNVSAKTFKYCPSTSDASQDTLQISNQSKICVGNSVNAALDGEYQYQSYSHQISALIYHNSENNKYIYAYITHDGEYQYYINHFESNPITVAKCIVSVNSTRNVLDIMDCLSKWHEYRNDTWNVNSNMFVVPCQDICVNGSYRWWIDGGTFKWLLYDHVRRSNVYICEECINSANNWNVSYLFGWISKVKYYWNLGPDFNDSLKWEWCTIGDIVDIGDNYIFSLNDCDTWTTWNHEISSWIIQPNMLISTCSTAVNSQVLRLSSLEVFQESIICVSGSDIHILDGQYKWLYYNSHLDGSIYYNDQTHQFLYPYITVSGVHQWHIHSDDISGYTEARCNMSSHITGLSFDINHCNDRWELYQNDSWVSSTSMLVLKCQDICFQSHDLPLISDQSSFKYLYFDGTKRSNVYRCDKCTGSFAGIATNALYLYGIVMDNTTAWWTISPDWDMDIPLSFCVMKINYTLNTSVLVLNIDDCMDSTWYTFDIDSNSLIWDDLQVIKCNHDPSAGICAGFSMNAKLSKLIQIRSYYQNLAIGFDITAINLNLQDKFAVEYICAATNVSNFITFDYWNLMKTPIMNFLYSLPPELCDNSSFVELIFVAETAYNSQNIYIDNVYLYYGVNSFVMIDNSNNVSNWNVNSGSFEVNNEMFNLQTDHGSADVTTIVDLSNTIYTYKNFNIKWSLITFGLSNTTWINIEIQCNYKHHFGDTC